MSGEASRRASATVDLDLCVGNGGCRRIAPTAFRRAGLGQSEFVEAHRESEATILEAAANCPVVAIEIEADDSGVSLS